MSILKLGVVNQVLPCSGKLDPAYPTLTNYLRHSASTSLCRIWKDDLDSHRYRCQQRWVLRGPMTLCSCKSYQSLSYWVWPPSPSRPLYAISSYVTDAYILGRCLGSTPPRDTFLMWLLLIPTLENEIFYIHIWLSNVVSHGSTFRRIFITIFVLASHISSETIDLT